MCRRFDSGPAHFPRTISCTRAPPGVQRRVRRFTSAVRCEHRGRYRDDVRAALPLPVHGRRRPREFRVRQRRPLWPSRLRRCAVSAVRASRSRMALVGPSEPAGRRCGARTLGIRGSRRLDRAPAAVDGRGCRSCAASGLDRPTRHISMANGRGVVPDMRIRSPRVSRALSGVRD